MIKKISASATYPLRQRYLRPGQPLAACAFAGDEDALTAHFGAYQGEQLVGIISVTCEKEPHLLQSRQWRLRGLAVAEEFRGQKIASRLCLAAQAYAKDQQGEIWWAYARPSSVQILLNLGGQQIGEAFELPNIGLHHLIVGTL